MKRIIVDLDETITVKSQEDYANAVPNLEVIDRLKDYRARGFEIVINTSRNMRTYAGNVGKINVCTLPTIMDWLTKNGVPYDEIYVGKPWCGTEGFYIDDKSIRPSEFVKLSYEQIQQLINPSRS